MLPSPLEPNRASEYPKPISQWLEIDYFRRPRHIWLVRRLLILGAFFGCLALVVGITVWPRGRRAYQAGPVSQAHAIFNENCAACHSLAFRPVSRLVRADESIRSVSDQACLHCHDGPIHHESQVGLAECADCHREHRGRESLSRVAESHCVVCHANPQAHTNPAKAPAHERRYRPVDRFTPDGHPDFALWMAPHDPGVLRFNHRAHMKPEGVEAPPDRKKFRLRCGDCHQPDAQERYMRPIRYEQDCARCHALTVPIRVAGVAAGDRADAESLGKRVVRHPMPGENVETVRATVREGLLQFLQGHAATQATKGPGPPARAMPGRRRAEPVSEGEWDWVERQLQQAERVLYDGSGGCRYCHEEETRPDQRPAGLPRYRKPNLPDRWLLHSVFSHDKHRPLDCEECHAGAAQSKDTGDVLMPRVAICQSCHRPGRESARADCAECHLYHDRGKDRGLQGELTIKDFVGAEPPRAKSATRP